MAGTRAKPIDDNESVRQDPVHNGVVETAIHPLRAAALPGAQIVEYAATGAGRKAAGDRLGSPAELPSLLQRHVQPVRHRGRRGPGRRGGGGLGPRKGGGQAAEALLLDLHVRSEAPEQLGPPLLQLRGQALEIPLRLRKEGLGGLRQLPTQLRGQRPGGPGADGQGRRGVPGRALGRRGGGGALALAGDASAFRGLGGLRVKAPDVLQQRRPLAPLLAPPQVEIRTTSAARAAAADRPRLSSPRRLHAEPGAEASGALVPRVQAEGGEQGGELGGPALGPPLGLLDGLAESRHGSEPPPRRLPCGR
mmetsp:Transcript_11420/g.40556  ORF Transcript_11420/g.40556 Transcript_11420/m.40556 type:complete len:307 (-) Transcript_11420:925-1845(-)